MLLIAFGCTRNNNLDKVGESEANAETEFGLFDDGSRASLGLIFQDFRVGTWQFYYPNGSRKAIGEYLDPITFRRHRVENGKTRVIHQTKYRQFLSEGDYHPDSTLVVYVDGPTFGVPNGIWLNFDSTGKVLSSFLLDQGIVVDTFFTPQ